MSYSTINSNYIGQQVIDPILGIIDYRDSSVCTSHLQARSYLAYLRAKHSHLLNDPVNQQLKGVILQLGGIYDTISLIQDHQGNLKIISGRQYLTAISQICEDRPVWDCQLFLKTITVPDLTSEAVTHMLTLINGSTAHNVTMEVDMSNKVMDNKLTPNKLSNEVGSEVSSEVSNIDEPVVILSDTEPCCSLGGVPSPSVLTTLEHSDDEPLLDVVTKVVNCIAGQYPRAFSDDPTKKRCFVPRLHCNTLVTQIISMCEQHGVTTLIGNELVAKIMEKNVEYSQRNIIDLFQRTGKRYHAKTKLKDCKLLQTIKKNGSWYLSCVYQPKGEKDEFRISDHSWLTEVIKSL